jgi:hypothetical protein
MTAKLRWLWILLLLPTWAKAAVLVTYRGDSPNLFDFSPVTLNSEDFDINGDGTPDFRFLRDPFVVALQSHGANRFISTVSVPPDRGGDVTPVLSGSIIGADTTFLAGDWHRHTDNGGGSGFGLNFGPNAMRYADAYIGVEFMLAGVIHYGWIQYVGFSHPEKGVPFPLLRGFIDSWAWETQPGVPIIAVAIPEPSTTVYIGGSAFLIWQRNAHTRKQNQALLTTPRGRFVSALNLVRKWLGFGRARPRP